MAEEDKKVFDLDMSDKVDFLKDVDLSAGLPDMPESDISFSVPENGDLSVDKETVDANSHEGDNEISFDFNEENADAELLNFVAEMKEESRTDAPLPEEMPEETDMTDNGSQASESATDAYNYEQELKKQRNSLQWYSGSLEEPVYEISQENMPDVLDRSHPAKVLHINVDSGYGWNVFFGNGVFMNLRDLSEYQERHGQLPYDSGKIIYGSQTTTFENLERIVVYEKPRYFEYKVQF